MGRVLYSAKKEWSMIKIQQMVVEGIPILGLLMEMGNAPLLVLKAPNGFVMCGYLNMETAEALGDAACMVRGVSDFEAMLQKEVLEVTRKAQELGISKGMKVREAILRLK